MEIDKMKKPDLVKLLRSTQQELKLLQAKHKELESGNVVAKTEASKTLTDLPYTGVAMIADSKGRSGEVLRIKFDLDGNALVDIENSLKFKEVYRANYRAVQLFEEVSARQRRPKPQEEVKGETDGN
jgi:hypothetical protein